MRDAVRSYLNRVTGGYVLTAEQRANYDTVMAKLEGFVEEWGVTFEALKDYEPTMVVALLGFDAQICYANPKWTASFLRLSKLSLSDLAEILALKNIQKMKDHNPEEHGGMPAFDWLCAELGIEAPLDTEKKLIKGAGAKMNEAALAATEAHELKLSGATESGSASAAAAAAAAGGVPAPAISAVAPIAASSPAPASASASILLCATEDYQPAWVVLSSAVMDWLLGPAEDQQQYCER